MSADPTLRADLISFLAAADARHERVFLRAGPRGCSRCKGDCDLPGQWYCKECRAAYAEKYREFRQKSSVTLLLFHTEAFQAGLALLRDAA